MSEGSVVIVGGTGGLGRALATHYRDKGEKVIITGRDPAKASRIASELGGAVSGLGFDLGVPETIAPALEGVGRVDKLVLTAIIRDNNPIRDYNIGEAVYLTTMKLVGYTATIHALLPNLHDDSSVVLFGGNAMRRMYPGSTTVTTVNGGISTMILTLALQLAPIRINAIHPGIVADSPYWEGKALEGFLARTPTGRLATMADIVDATVFLLENRSVNAANLYVDGGTMLM